MYFAYRQRVFVFHYFVKQSILELTEDVGIFRSYPRSLQDGDPELELRVHFEVTGEFLLVYVGEEIHCFGFRLTNIWLYTSKSNDIYCGIIIVRWGPMFVAFMGNPCPQSYIPTNVYTSRSLIFIKIIPSPRTRKILTTHEH